MSKFGDLRNRRDVFEDYLKKGGNTTATNTIDEVERTYIGNVNTLSDFNSDNSTAYATPPANSPENLRRKKNLSFIKDYFSDKSTYYFKHGLEVANNTRNPENLDNIENLSEDPVIFGFDFEINNINSPLYNEAPSFFEFARNNSLTEIINREDIYNDFIQHLELLFNRTTSGFNSFKSHYLLGIDGMNDLINKSSNISVDKQFAKFGNDKLKMTLREDNTLSGGYLSMLYNTLSYSRINGKEIIPSNLLRFDCKIIISEIRNYVKIKRFLSNGEDARNFLPTVKDNISRYIYNLYDCQFYFDSHSHPSNVRNDNKDITDTFDFNIFYKFSTMEMEKFSFNPNGEVAKYLNDGNRLDPTKKFVGEVGGDSLPPNTNDVQEYSIHDRPRSNNILPDKIVTTTDVDDINTLRYNSIQENLREQERRKNDSISEDSIRNVGLRSGERLGEYEGDPRRGSSLRDAIQRSSEFALQRVRQIRGELIQETLNNIRRSTGLKRISKPDNVYDENFTILGFARNEFSTFVRGGFDDFIRNTGNRG